MVNKEQVQLWNVWDHRIWKNFFEASLGRVLSYCRHLHTKILNEYFKVYLKLSSFLLSQVCPSPVLKGFPRPLLCWCQETSTRLNCASVAFKVKQLFLFFFVLEKKVNIMSTTEQKMWRQNVRKASSCSELATVMLNWHSAQWALNHRLHSEDGFHCFSIQGAEISCVLDIAHKLDGRRSTNLCQKSAAYMYRNLTENFLWSLLLLQLIAQFLVCVTVFGQGRYCV